jgi:hypothetical protein
MALLLYISSLHGKTPGDTGNKTGLFLPIITHVSVTNI